MSCTQYRSVPAYRNHKIDIQKVLPIQLYPIDTRELDVVAIQYIDEIVDALLMGVVARFEAFPSECFRRLSSCP